ncbi:rhamnosyltransferase [Bacteroidia bacterium]|nr:rhamnosyltransferase [Bacteroidia bacterium]
MKIAIISTRGIPNNYGGFEQFAEYISVGLVQRGHEVTVYSPRFHPYREDNYKGVRIKHIYSPEQWLGSSMGSFFYDFNSLRDALHKENFDIIYVAGYTSIIPAFIRFNVKNIKKPVFTTNMDGLEYKRTKFNRWTQKFLFLEERMAVKHSHYLIADNQGIQDYYKKKYEKDIQFLAYGANIYDNYNTQFLEEVDLQENNYFLVIARLEPENNIDAIIQGYLNSNQKNIKPLIVIGKTDTLHGKYLVKKYSSNKSVRFIGGVYSFDKVNSIRYFSTAYLHGHSVGGTNPSLLEAMAAGCFIVANDNIFNKSVCNGNAMYFNTSKDISLILNNIDASIKTKKSHFVEQNLEQIKSNCLWEKLVDDYEKYFYSLV